MLNYSSHSLQERPMHHFSTPTAQERPYAPPPHLHSTGNTSYSTIPPPLHRKDPMPHHPTHNPQARPHAVPPHPNSTGKTPYCSPTPQAILYAPSPHLFSTRKTPCSTIPRSCQRHDPNLHNTTPIPQGKTHTPPHCYHHQYLFKLHSTCSKPQT